MTFENIDNRSRKILSKKIESNIDNKKRLLLVSRKMTISKK